MLTSSTQQLLPRHDVEVPHTDPGRHWGALPGSPSQQYLGKKAKRLSVLPSNPPKKHFLVHFNGPTGKARQHFLLTLHSRKKSWWPWPVHLCWPPLLCPHSHFFQRQRTAQCHTLRSTLRAVHLNLASGFCERQLQEETGSARDSLMQRRVPTHARSLTRTARCTLRTFMACHIHTQ